MWRKVRLLCIADVRELSGKETGLAEPRKTHLIKVTSMFNQQHFVPDDFLAIGKLTMMSGSVSRCKNG